ncbi:hypothetical protein HHI36_018173 [Cryptolaemus montrouzieri]|uniref:Uncharacterized protein n=1 Tax=Cryptolaemus montrouzieri TaxID=559131 RepID=A0ABD2NZK5_9CUCU
MEKVMTLEHDLEPRWILDETHSGSHFWRRETVGTTARVKFLKEVEIKEFVRWEFENDEGNEIYESNFVNVAMTLFLCVLITVMLPWYLVIGR